MADRQFKEKNELFELDYIPKKQIDDGKSLTSIQVLRGIAALMVGFAHLHAVETKLGGQIIFGKGFLNGFAGVDLFFLISGFVMVFTNRNLKPGIGKSLKFWCLRLMRIYPLWWAVCGAIYVVYLYHPNWVYSSSNSHPDILKSFLLIPQNELPLHAVGWTLIHELWFYAVFGVLILAPRKALFPLLIVWGILTGIGSNISTQSPFLLLITHPQKAAFIGQLKKEENAIELKKYFEEWENDELDPDFKNLFEKMFNVDNRIFTYLSSEHLSKRYSFVKEIVSTNFESIWSNFGKKAQNFPSQTFEAIDQLCRIPEIIPLVSNKLENEDSELLLDLIVKKQGLTQIANLLKRFSSNEAVKSKFIQKFDNSWIESLNTQSLGFEIGYATLIRNSKGTFDSVLNSIADKVMERFKNNTTPIILASELNIFCAAYSLTTINEKEKLDLANKVLLKNEFVSIMTSKAFTVEQVCRVFNYFRKFPLKPNCLASPQIETILNEKCRKIFNQQSKLNAFFQLLGGYYSISPERAIKFGNNSKNFFDPLLNGKAEFYKDLKGKYQNLTFQELMYLKGLKAYTNYSTNLFSVTKHRDFMKYVLKKLPNNLKYSEQNSLENIEELNQLIIWASQQLSS